MHTLLFLIVFAASQPKTACTPQFAPLRTGSYSGDSKIPFWPKEEGSQWQGGGWIGWNISGDSLEPVRLTVKNRPKEENDDHEYVTVEIAPDVTYAVRCMPSVRAGRIHNAGIANHELDFDGPLNIAIGKAHYVVRLQATDQHLTDAKVVLSNGRQTQVLYDAAEGFTDEPHFNIEWAGDLDRDGRLDLVVNLSRKYSLHPHRLLLSSRARAGQLVGEAGVFVSSD